VLVAITAIGVERGPQPVVARMGADQVSPNDIPGA
jgi:hypothetical protein